MALPGQQLCHYLHSDAETGMLGMLFLPLPVCGEADPGPGPIKIKLQSIEPSTASP